MRRNKKKNKQLALLLILLGITVGFALLSTTLKINGTAGIKSSQWDIHWENVQPNAQSTVTTETPQISENATKVTYTVNLELPGDFYEFTVDAVNDGSINGKITEVKSTIYVLDPTTGEEVIDEQTSEPTTVENLPSYINYTIYYDGTTTRPALNDILEAGDSQKYRVRIEYDPLATTLPGSDLSYKIVDEITYTQTKDSSTPDDPTDTSIPGLWFYEINNDGEHTASIVAVNEEYDAGMSAMTTYERGVWDPDANQGQGAYVGAAGTEFYDDTTFYNADDEEEPYVNHAPAYFKNLVIPSTVKLDAEGKYDPVNGTEYTLTRFYDTTGMTEVSQSKLDYIEANHGVNFWGKCYAVESIVFPNTYKTIELTYAGWYNLSSMTLSNQLTNLPNIGGDCDYSEALDPRVEITLPATVTRTPQYGFGSMKARPCSAVTTAISRDKISPLSSLSLQETARVPSSR